MTALTRIPTHVVEKLINAAVELHSDSWLEDYETRNYVPEVRRENKQVTVLVFGEVALLAQDLWEGNAWRVDTSPEIVEQMLRSL